MSIPAVPRIHRITSDYIEGTAGIFDVYECSGVLTLILQPTNNRREIKVVNITGDNVDIEGSDGATFNGDSSYTLTEQYQSVSLLANGLIGNDAAWDVTAGMPNLTSADGSVTFTTTGDSLDFAINPAASDAATAAHNHLFVAADVVSAQTVTVGADVFEVEIVNTDTTDNTQGGDFLSSTNPLVVVDAVTNYTNVFAKAVGDLIRIGSEIMRITAKGAANLTFARGVSGTTIAGHLDAADIFGGNGIVAGTAVGLVTTLTPTAFKAAFVDDFNSEGTEGFTASSTSNGVTITADVAGDEFNGTTCSETLTGAGNAWQSTLTYGGQDAGQKPLVYRALLSQTSTTAPTANVLENTIGQIVWTYGSTGVYTGTLVAAFANPTSLAVGTPPGSGAGHYSVFTVIRASDDALTLNTWDVTASTGAAALADALLTATYIEIIVWP